MKKLMFTFFVVFAMLLVSCPHAKNKPGNGGQPLPSADPALKGTTWESSDYQVITFSNDSNLAIMKNPSYPFGLELEAPYEVKDQKEIRIKLDGFIYKLENFGEKEFGEAYKVMVIDPMIISLQDDIDNPQVPDEAKAKLRENIIKLKNGVSYLTNKAGIKKFIIEILFPMNIEEIEGFLNDPKVPDDLKEKMKVDLAKMKEMLADTSKIDEMLEQGHAELKEAIAEVLPAVKASNPITLKCEDGETVKTTDKLISSSDFTVEVLPFMSPIKFGDGDEFMKK